MGQIAKLSDADALAAWRAYREAGTFHGAAKLLGVSADTARSRKRKAEERGLHLSEGVQDVIQTARLSPNEALGGWIHNYDGEGKKVGATYWKSPEPAPTDYAGEVRAIFEGTKPTPPVTAPDKVIADLCALYPLFDVHWGMHAWGVETGGQDYDIKHGATDMERAFSKVMALTPDADTAILLLGGDFFHADDNRAETPQSKHKLDVDTRHWKILDSGIQVIVNVISWLLAKHRRVLVRVMRGNHDEHSHMVLSFALAQRYREEPRIEVENTPRDLFQFEWGKTAVFAHHGDKAKAERLTLYISDVCSFWSSSRHRYCFTGHVHHDSTKDFGALRWESLRAFCPPDAYAAGMGYSARRALQAMTFDKTDGLVLRAIDPIERHES